MSTTTHPNLALETLIDNSDLPGEVKTALHELLCAMSLSGDRLYSEGGDDAWLASAWRVAAKRYAALLDTASGLSGGDPR
jgi:hypothetical protein